MSGAVRRALARLAEGSAPASDASRSDREMIRRAAAATGDVERAAAFVESVGLDRLRAATERADGDLAARGRRALAAFEWARWAARHEGDSRQRDHPPRSG